MFSGVGEHLGGGRRERGAGDGGGTGRRRERHCWLRGWKGISFIVNMVSTPLAAEPLSDQG